MNLIITNFYRLPLHIIPFHDIPSLKSLSYQYIACSSFPLESFTGMNSHLVSIYNAFDEDINCADQFPNGLLFGSVICGKLPTRGKMQCLALGSTDSESKKEDLPHLKYSSNGMDPLEGNWFYMKEGKYFILNSIASTYDKVKHLEGIALYSDSLLRLRIVVELLKKNILDRIVSLTIQDFKDIGYIVLKAEPTFAKIKDDMLKDGINNWILPMLLTPHYTEIPQEIRGRVIV